MYKLRDYQKKAVESGLKLFNSDKRELGICILPSGAGKSLVIASVGKQLKGDTIVFQPTLEILEQNLSKIHEFGFHDVGVFSASAKRKDFGKITFATIGSIFNRKEEWGRFKNIIVDECQLVSAKSGMYSQFIKENGGSVLGVTATPYRLHSYQDMHTGERSVVAKILTRTRPKIFTKIIHITQMSTLYEQKYLCPIKYIINKNYRHEDIELNSTGMDFNEEKLKEYNEKQNIIKIIANAIKEEKAKHILVFNVFVSEAELLSANLREFGISAETISAKTSADERKQKLKDFKSGKIKVMTNVGVFSVGFDFPELDCVILARPTQSVSLFYQMVGRGIRIAKNKKYATIIDVCGNIERFGKIETFSFVAYKGDMNKLRLKSNVGYLTGYDFVSNCDLEDIDYLGYQESQGWGNDVIRFGRYKGTHIKKVPLSYLEWCVETFSTGKYKKQFQEELSRRLTSRKLLGENTKRSIKSG